MEVLENRRPKNVAEYFTWLYCQRMKLRWGATGTKIHRKAMKTWKTLSEQEQDVFIKKYNKWQAENDKRVADILQYTEPFMKKKHTARENLDVETHITEAGSCNDNQVEQTMNSSHMPASNDNNLSILEVTNQENLIAASHITEACNTDTPNDDNLSIATSENADRVYAASVIDPEIDETSGQEIINAPIQSERLTEPTRPTVKNAKELFEIFQSSGTRPELAAIQWKDLCQRDKSKYFCAIQTMRRQYLIEYEKYLESLSSPDLFKHYIKTLNR